MERLFSGIDAGSSATKVALIDAEGRIRGHAVSTTGIDFEGAAQKAFERALTTAGASKTDVVRTAATGYGRRAIKGTHILKTEIACHAEGAFSHFKEAMTVLDIGGQDGKVIEVGGRGEVIRFKMNRKCAAGTGAFLEDIAHKMNIPLRDMNALAASCEEAYEIGAFCTVFAAQQVLQAAKKGIPVPSIVRGVYASLVKRALEIGNLAGKVVVTGGVVENNPIMSLLLAEALGRDIESPPLPQLTGAVGAARFALAKGFEEDKR